MRFSLHIVYDLSQDIPYTEKRFLSKCFTTHPLKGIPQTVIIRFGPSTRLELITLALLYPTQHCVRSTRNLVYRHKPFLF